MEYCQTCCGRKELIGLGLITQTCPACLGTGLKKESVTSVNAEPKKRRRKTEKTHLVEILDEHIREGINEESHPILPRISNNAE